MSNNLTLKIAANYPNPPFFYSENQKVVFGIDYLLIETLSKYLNISYEFRHSHWQWGELVNGSWTGMIGHIVNNTANMALGVLTANPSRVEAVDFTIPYFYSDITFVMRMNTKSSLNANSLLVEPMTTDVWLTLLSSILFSVIAVKAAKQSTKLSLFIVIRTLLDQNIPSIPESLRLFSTIWLLCGFVITNYYSSFLFMFMSELIPRPDISSIEELALAVKNGHYIPGASADGSIFQFIKDLTIPPIDSLGKALIPINKTSSALKAMLTDMPNLVFICPRLLVNVRIMSLGIEFFHIPPPNENTNFLTEQLAIALPKNFVLKSQINKLIRRLESSAHLYHWEMVCMRENNRFFNSSDIMVTEDQEFKGLALNTIKYILYLWIIGSFISVLIIICEIEFEKFSRSILISNIRKAIYENRYKVRYSDLRKKSSIFVVLCKT